MTRSFAIAVMSLTVALVACGDPTGATTLGNAAPRARLAAPWDKRHDRLEFLRGRLASSEDGSLLVEPDPADGSHRMRAAADADALIVLDEGARRLEAGDVVQVLPY